MLCLLSCSKNKEFPVAILAVAIPCASGVTVMEVPFAGSKQPFRLRSFSQVRSSVRRLRHSMYCFLCYRPNLQICLLLFGNGITVFVGFYQVFAIFSLHCFTSPIEAVGLEPLQNSMEFKTNASAR